MRKNKVSEHEYLLKCQAECGDRMSDASLFKIDVLQKNSLRVESLRDTSARCGQKPPEHCHDDAKRRGWGMLVFSG